MKKIFTLVFILMSGYAFGQLRICKSEQFDNNNGSWPVGDNENRTVDISEGHYKIWHKRSEGSWSFWTSSKLLPADDFHIKTKIKQANGDSDSEFGLYLRQEDEYDHYFYITSNGEFNIEHDDVSIKKGTSSSIKPKGEYNLLEVIKKKGETTFLINGTTVYSTTSYQFATHKMGWSLANNTEIHVDFIEAFRDPQPFDLVENFNNNDAAWFTGSASDYDISVANGKYNINYKKKGSGYTFINYYTVDWRENFSVETMFKIIKPGKDDGFGIYMKNGDDERYYFYVESDGDYALRKIDGDDDRTIRNRKCPVTISDGVDITMKLEHKDNDLLLYVNGQKIETLNYEKFVAPHIGFIIYDKMKVEVDYIRVTQTPRPIKLVDDAVRGFKRVNLGLGLNSEYEDYAPVISPDGKTMFFNRDDHPEIEEIWGESNSDIYYSTMNPDGTWSKAQNMGKPLNNSGNNFVISITPDMNTVLVGNTYLSDGSPDGSGLSISHRTSDGSWSIPKEQEIDNYYNYNDYVSYTLSPDQKVLVMAVERDDVIGEKDFYVSFKTVDETWTEPKHMGNVINTFEDEYTPFIAADGKTMYFASEGHPGYGSADLFVSKRLDDTWTNWSTPKNMGPEINTPNWDAYFKIPASGDVAYLVSTLQSYGSEDIFRIELPQSARPDPVVLIKGKVLNSKTNEPIGAAIRYRLLSNDKEVGIASSNANDGSYQIALPYGENYSFMAEKEGFYAISDNMDLTNLKEYTEIERDLYLAPIEKGEIIRLNNLFFEFDSPDLLEESYGELNRLVKILNERPKMKIEIGGHSDSKGSDDYNLTLSEKRANSVVAYLADKGISKDRLVAKGYGETKPVATNDTEEGRQLNRRVEFTILED